MSGKKRNQTDKQTEGFRGFKTPIHIATIPPQTRIRRRTLPSFGFNFFGLQEFFAAINKQICLHN